MRIKEAEIFISKLSDESSGSELERSTTASTSVSSNMLSISHDFRSKKNTSIKI